MGSKDKTDRRACGCIYVGAVLIAKCPTHRRGG